jgi:hypothetical protein
LPEGVARASADRLDGLVVFGPNRGRLARIIRNTEVVPKGLGEPGPIFVVLNALEREDESLALHPALDSELGQAVHGRLDATGVRVPEHPLRNWDVVRRDELGHLLARDGALLLLEPLRETEELDLLLLHANGLRDDGEP